MTKYAVLRQLDVVLPPLPADPEATDAAAPDPLIFPALVPVGEFDASDGDAACKAAASSLYKDAGVVGRVTLVAVPARSYQPAELTIEQEPNISVVARVGGPPVGATA